MTPSRPRSVHAPLVASLAALSLLFAPAADAARVSVQEAAGTNIQVLSYAAFAGEDNNLTISVASKSGSYLQLQVLDSGAAVEPGAGCAGSGLPGEAVRCTVHEPKFADTEACGKLLCNKPGTSWEARMKIDLGDGANSFDAGSFAGEFGDRFDMDVSSGAGDDRIVTGGGEDTIDPGGGSDEVHSGVGYDRVETTAVPDDPDLYELGTDGSDQVSYQQRTDPVSWRGETGGAAGEGDWLLDVEYVLGGSGPDVLVGGPGFNRLDGGPGNDLLSDEGGPNQMYGGPGDDVLAAGEDPAAAAKRFDSVDRLIGEAGDDTYYGSNLGDVIREHDFHGEPGFTPNYGWGPDDPDGNDVAYGAGGSDAIELGIGNDHAFGGPGRDQIHTGPGMDVLLGGADSDNLIGDTGFDKLWGGPGSDRLFSGRKAPRDLRVEFPFPAAKDDGRDLVGCGPARDKAEVNPWDRTRGCETIRLLRPRS